MEWNAGFKLPDPAVTAEINQIAAFWLDEVGVDGFRVDGARHLIEDGKIQENSEATHAWFKAFYNEYKNLNPQAVTIGEVWDSNFSAVKYVKEDEFDLVFDFELAKSLMEGINGYDAKKIQNALDFNTNLYPDLQKANFLTNHDMNRVIHVFQGDETKAKLAAVLLLTAPGVPFIYYGEEIGMTGAKPDEAIRRPMQWSTETHAGFTTGNPWESLNQNYEDWNVEDQVETSSSLLTLYRSLIHLRNESSALRVGDYVKVESKETGITAFLRKNEDQIVLIILNPSREAKQVSLMIRDETLSEGEYVLNASMPENSIADQVFLLSPSEYFSPVKTLAAGDYLILEIIKQ